MLEVRTQMTAAGSEPAVAIKHFEAPCPLDIH